MATPPRRAASVPLTPYRAPDGGATAWVPSDPDWTISSSQGALEGSGPRGNVLLGQTFSIVLPGAAPGPLPSTSVVAPFTNAADALQTVWPQINRNAGINMSDVRVRSLLADATLPTFRSSGMMVFDYDQRGRPYAGVANVGIEDRLGSYSNFFWQMYISVIAVPVDGDPTVGAALRLVWRSWNPSGDRGASRPAWKGVADPRPISPHGAPAPATTRPAAVAGLRQHLRAHLVGPPAGPLTIR